MKIAIIEPFFTGSHKVWAEGYQGSSRHEVEIYSLSGHHWKWRMHGGALSLAQQFLQSSFQPDLILATDMLDLGTFLAATRHRTGEIPCALYFHENQLTYPRQQGDRDVQLNRDLHYSFINFSSAAVADRVFFNSYFHQHTFLEQLPGFLKRFPDQHCLEWVGAIQEKSQVLPIGMTFPQQPAKSLAQGTLLSPPVLVWNHRWEYDKGPESFFEILFYLQEEGYDFRLIVLGESYPQQPPIFEVARNRLASKLLHWGYVPDQAAYFDLLSQGSILPVTSLQDFFGISVVEAMYAGLVPMVPQSGVYKEHIPKRFHELLLYKEPKDLQKKLMFFLEDLSQLHPINPAAWVSSYAWENLAPRYDTAFELVDPIAFVDP